MESCCRLGLLFFHEQNKEVKPSGLRSDDPRDWKPKIRTDGNNGKRAAQLMEFSE